MDTHDKATARGQIIISTDGHAGADLRDYKSYLEERYHNEFEAWAEAYVDPWGVLGRQSATGEKVGFASFDSVLNWDRGLRTKLIDTQGISAEVLFPNTAPPFHPSGVFNAAPPLTEREYELRFAGVQAHNRWMVDFCQDLPGRRAGFVQVFLNDLDDTIRAVQWGRENGLMGVLLPGDHPLKLTNLYYPELDRLWQVCEDLEMPVHRHQTLPAESSPEAGPAAMWTGLIEVPLFGKRGIPHVICAGVFERFPNLKFVTTEINDGAAIPSMLDQLDMMFAGAFGSSDDDGAPRANPTIADAVRQLTRKPSDYFRTNCFMAGPLDWFESVAVGTPNLMFGADFPHAEGTGPFTRLAVRLEAAAVPPSEVDEILFRRAASVYGFDLGYLQTVADRIGPTRHEVRSPALDADLPTFGADTSCRIFAGAIAGPPD